MFSEYVDITLAVVFVSPEAMIISSDARFRAGKRRHTPFLDIVIK